MNETGSILMMSGLLSIGLLLSALVSFLRSRAFVNSAHKAQGKVIKLVEKSIGGGNHDFFPVFSFIALDGQEIIITQKANRPRFKVGTPVEVLFDPQHPQDAKINAWFNFYFFPALQAVFGVAAGLAGIIAAF